MSQHHLPHLKKRYRPWLWVVLAVILVIGISVKVAGQFSASASTPRQASAKVATKPAKASKQAKNVKKRGQQAAAKSRSDAAAPSVMRKPIDWHQPSETVAYPKFTSSDKVAIQVSLAKQRVYILVNNKKAYTMYASTGVDNLTPKGHFQIGTRGDHFYTPSEHEGANYWTAFSGTGYLFHSVPTDVNGNYLPKEAAKLGKEPASHGCVRLSIADAKWINATIPAGTPVVIS